MGMIGLLKIGYGKVNLMYKILDEEGYGYECYKPSELHELKTRQLLKLLRSTYSWDYAFGSILKDRIEEYQLDIKHVLATREHIPNKIESKIIRKQRKLRGV